MTRLDQAVAVRDAILQRCPDWYSSEARTVLVPVPGFNCMLSRYADGRQCGLDIWPDRGERGGHKMLGGKVLSLRWDNAGHAELVSIRKPNEWLDQLHVTLDPESGRKAVSQ